MTEKKSRVVTVEMLRDAARKYTELRRSLDGLSENCKLAHERLIVLMKRASATTVKAYILSDVGDMNKVPNPNLLKKGTDAEK